MGDSYNEVSLYYSYINRASDKDYWMPRETLLHRDDSHFHPISMAHGSPQGSEGTSSQSNSASNEIIVP